MATFELKQSAIIAEGIWGKAREGNRLTHSPSDEELRGLVEKEPEVKITTCGNFVARREPSSRSLMFTENSVDHTRGRFVRTIGNDNYVVAGDLAEHANICGVWKVSRGRQGKP